MFSTVVDPGNDETSEDASVHGIPRAELLLGPHFAEAFGRLEQFLQYACLSVLESDDDSEDGRLPPVAMKQNLEVTVVAHNGLKFDFPFLLQECIRAGLGPSAMAGWVYVMMRPGRNWATKEQNYLWQTGSSKDTCSGSMRHIWMKLRKDHQEVSSQVVLEAHDIPRAHHRYLLQDRFCNIADMIFDSV